MNNTQTPGTQPLPRDGDNSTIMGILSYIGVLVIIPLLVAKDNSFVKFHVKQGVVLAVIEIILWILSGMFWGLYPIVSLINLILVIFSIIGVVNVVQHQEKEIPILGSLSKYVTI